MVTKMKDNQCVRIRVLLSLAALRIVSASEGASDVRVLRKHNQESKLERVVVLRNKSSDIFHGGSIIQEKHPSFAPRFAKEVSSCIEERQYQITENVSQGKAVILNCFKTALILNVLKYMGEPQRSNIKLFDGLFELEKISGACEEASENSEEAESCVNKYGRRFGEKKRRQYMRMYEKAMLRLINERNKLNAYRNQTEEDREKLLKRIRENSESFLSEVIRSIGNADAERTEEEDIKKEVADPKLLAVLDEVSKNYLLKLRFYPGVAARMMRSHNGGFTFDLELDDLSEEDDGQEEEVDGDEESTREIKDGPQSKEFDEEDDDSNTIKRKKSKGDKKKKKEKKKKEKKLKKIVPYLLIPMLIQMTLLPFVFKKLFFLAMKALFAGKVALILVGFNLLRNTCIQNEDDFQKIRVEHYGYRGGEEYGAWVNGRSLQESLILAALSEGSFGGRKPVTS